MRLINADKLVDMLYDNEFAALCPLDEVSGVIDACPTVDAVPVVRCKDCKYYKPDEFECGCDFAGGLPYVKADDFCSYGQRRDQSADVRYMDGGGADAT